MGARRCDRPARNSSPCRAVSNNDPLESLQLRIIDRSAGQ
jgi:hypothetical protein